MTSPADGDPAATGGPGPPDAVPGSPETGAGSPPAPGSLGPSPTTTPTVTRSGPSAVSRGLSTGLGPAGGAAGQIVSGDWPAQAADRIVDLVDTVRDKTTGPIQTAARGTVYGLVAVILAVVVFVLLIIFAIRGLDILVNEFIPWGGIWLPYLILGVVFIVAGSFFFRRRRQTPT